MKMKKSPAKMMSCGDSDQSACVAGEQPSEALGSGSPLADDHVDSLFDAFDPLGVNGLLHSQLHSLRVEKATVTKALATARAELVEVGLRRDAERQDLAGVGGSDAAAARIMELSRRVRYLTAELEIERTRRRRLEAMHAAPPPQEQEQKRQLVRQDGAESTVEPPQETVAHLRDQLRDTTRRLVEARNQAQAARREVRQAERLLQQEVGGTATLQGLLTSGTGWRGRAQQIVTLRAQLQEMSVRQSGAVESAGEGLPSAGTARSELRLSAVDCRVRSHILSLGKDQRAAARQAAEEARQQAEENSALKLKLDAARSRAAVVGKEVVRLREQTSRLAEKCRNDDEMIEALLLQVRQLETTLTDGCRPAATHDSRPTLAHVGGQQVALLRAQLAARDERVAQLEAAARQEPRRSPSPPSPQPAEHVTALCRKCIEADFLLEAAQAERRRLMDLVRQLQARLSEFERQLDEANKALQRERDEAAGARREADRLQQMLGRSRRTTARPSDQVAGASQRELALARDEAESLRQELETLRRVRDEDLNRYEGTIEEARDIFCRGLSEASQQVLSESR